jgi:hypothetical protein
MSPVWGLFICRCSAECPPMNLVCRIEPPWLPPFVGFGEGLLPEEEKVMGKECFAARSIFLVCSTTLPHLNP